MRKPPHHREHEFGVDCKTRGQQCVDQIDRIFRTATGRQIALEELLPEFSTDEPAVRGEKTTATTRRGS